MTATGNDTIVALRTIDACVAHARQLLASQLPDVEIRNYDFLPIFKEMTTQLYLAGVMWRFGEHVDLPTAARDRGFICLMSMLVSDGMNTKKAQKRIAHLNEVSRTSAGQDVLAITAGYGAKNGDGSLAAVFDTFRGVPEVSGAPFRLLNRSKTIAAILTVGGAAISLVVGSTWGEALGVGIFLGVLTLAIALVRYRQEVKAKEH
jgi:hypothetical protein